MNTTQAISELKQFLSFKRASEHAEDVLQKLQDAEQSIKDCEKITAKLKAEAETLSGANAKAKNTIAEAEKKAAAILSDAESKASAEIEKSRAVIIAENEANKKKISDAKKKLDAIEVEITKANNEALEAKKRLVELNNELEATKARFKALV